jgi:hypothetical protein
VCQRLIVMTVIVDAIVMLVGIGTDNIGFQLQIEVLDGEGIDILDAQLKPLLIGPVAFRVMQDLVQNEFVDQQLPV